MFDEAVTTFEEYLEKGGTLNDTGEIPKLQLKARQERAGGRPIRIAMMATYKVTDSYTLVTLTHDHTCSHTETRKV